MPAWLPDPAALLSALALVLVPGALVGVVLRIRGWLLLGLAGPLSLALIGVSAVLGGFAGVRFGWWSPLALAVLSCVAALGARAWRARRPGGGPAPVGRWDATTALVSGAVVVSAVVVAWRGLGSIGDRTWFPQTYDAVFHLNAAASILDGGSASSLTLYRLTHPGEAFAFYPGGWHALVSLVAQISGTGVAEASNAAWWAVAGVVWPLGCVVLTRTLFGDRRLLLVGAALLASAFAAFPYLLLDWGTLYPTGVAYALLPTGLALTILAARTLPGLGDPTGPDLGSWRTWALLAVWFAGAGLCHPRSLVTWVVLVVPLAAAALGRVIRRSWAGPHRARLVLVLASGTTALAVVAAAGVLFVFRYYDVAARPVSTRLSGGPATAHQGLGASLAQVLAQAPVVSPSERPLPWAWALGLLVLAGLVAAALRPGRRWVVVAYALLAALYCLAAGSNGDLAKLATGLWYKDKYRLAAALPVLGVPLASLAVAEAARLAARWRARYASPVAAALLAVVVAASWLGPTLAGVQRAVGAQFAVPTGDKRGALVDADELALLRRLPELVPAGVTVVGNPWDGSALSWAVGRRQAVFPHMTGAWDPDRVLVAAHLDAVATDPAVCQAVRRLRIGYLFVSDGLLWGGDPQARAFPGIDAAATVPGFTEVAHSGGTRLLRITSCAQPAG